MRSLDLSAVDLNLLVVLEALLVERQVTRAATRLATSQPAVSRALTRLRELFDDDLMVRVGQHMQLTPKAASLLPRVQDVLARVDAVLAPDRFDPKTATGSVRLAAPDIIAYMLGPALVRRVAAEAPGLSIEIVQWSTRWRDHLASGEVDLTFGQVAGREPGFYSRLLVSNTWASVLRRGHPMLRKPWTLDSYLALSHLLIGFTPHGGGHVDTALAELGLRRRVALRMPYVVLSPLIIAETDLVLTTARWLAAKLAKPFGLIIREPPVTLAPVDIPMLWHERSHRDPRQRWLRATLKSLAEQAGMVGSSHPRRG